MSNIPTAEEFIIQKQKELGYNPMNKVPTTEIKNNMKKTKLIPFDLERWQKGDFKRVVDICGTEITQLTYFKDVNDIKQLRGVRLSAIESWRSNGSWFDKPNPLDLFLEVEKKPLEGWVNVFKDTLGSTVYSSKEEAVEIVSDSPIYITTIHITYNNDNDM
jgi:hypothetical protein